MYATWLEGVLEKDHYKVKRSHQTGDALRDVMYDYERTFERDYMVAADRARSAPPAPEKGRLQGGY
ncbi:hypothetical protein HYV43_03695 [Candidatus Micrarchaeota archaeon]|nr:hypothetical protein [Candidatus Micrarchaeota archaeon]